MNKVRSFVKTLIVLSVLHSGGRCRKYDVDDEALKLYGEDLKTVLKRFRRTPDYLKILNDQVADIKSNLEDVSTQIIFYYNRHLEEKIAEMFSKDSKENHDGSTATPSYLRNRIFYPMIDSPFSYHFQKRFHHLKRPGREGEEAGEDTNNIPLDLDKYPLFEAVLTTQERNNFRDMGFDYAGKIIHAIIKSMDHEDFSQKSTKSGQDDRYKTSTTAHSSDHGHSIVNTHGDELSTAAAVIPTDETFKYRYRAPSG